MSKLPSVVSLKKEDFKDAPPWADRLFRVLSLFMKDVYEALNKNLTVDENLLAAYKTFQVTAGAASSNNTLSFSYDLRRRPRYVYVISATRPDGVLVNSAVFVSWTHSAKAKEIDITAISMLFEGVVYDITVRIE